MEKKFIIKTEDEMIRLGEVIGQLAFPSLVITMHGDLGAGKTTMTKGIGKALGVKRVINSPTFTIMKVYEANLTLYHMDVYHINNDSGDEYLEEYFYLDGVTVIEWADNISNFLPKDRIEIDIVINDSFNRVVTIKSNTDNLNYLNLLKEIKL